MDITIPNRIVIEKKAISLIDKICSNKPLIIADPITYKIAGKSVETKLECQAEIVEDIGKFQLKTKPDCIVAVGGGKILDLGKLLAFRADRPLVAIPTAPSHDGIFSPIVTLREIGITSLKASPPWAVIADLEILAKAPKRMIAAGAADAIAKYTSVWDWAQAAKRKKDEMYSDFVANIALLAFELVKKHSEDIAKASYSGIKVLIEALLSSGLAMCLTGSSRPASGSEHNFGHALDSLGAKILHGEAVGLGTIIAAYLQGQDWQLVKKLLAKVGAPTTLAQAGVEREIALKALMRAKDIRPRWTVLNAIRLNRKTAEKIFQRTAIV